jgi:hypothetical protein
MRRAIKLLLIFSIAVAACGFGLDDDSGNPEPATTYWGWQCADGSTPSPDAGCPATDGGP